MKSIGIFYGSTTGTTEQVAMEIAEALGVAEADVHDVTKSAPSEVGAYDVLLFGAILGARLNGTVRFACSWIIVSPKKA